MRENALGVFDSGVGGLTVFSELTKKLPCENYIYFGDTKNLPYGSKTKQELLSITRRIFDFFAEQKLKAVVMACNTTSALVYDDLKNDYDFILYPIIQTSLKSIMKQNYKRVGVFATQGTIKSGVYGDVIRTIYPDCKVLEIACPEFVPMVETGNVKSHSSEQVVKGYVDLVKEFKPEAVILGCTHYPYLLDLLSKFAPISLFIDPSAHFVDFVKEDLQEKGLLSDLKVGTREFYVSSSPEDFVEHGKIFYDIAKTPSLLSSF